MIVTLLGAPNTGKSSLVQAIVRSLSDQGLDAIAANDTLSAWKTQYGRWPQQHELAAFSALAQEQIAHAATTHRIVVTHTSALMVAVHSQYSFNDPSLLLHALAMQRHIDITLVAGLDWPWLADERPPRTAIDTLLRSALVSEGIRFQTVYGLGTQRVQNALDCLAPALGLATPSGAATTSKWTWVCDKCSDPVCEHKLFSQLQKPVTISN
jgi:HTH-type transcriptional regulator, transcriptional repressor of NAD biosynthesis genes